jgi:hypothetical protein
MYDDVTRPAAGLWTLLILDRDDLDDPRWLIATITPDDVRPATESSHEPGEDTRAWVASRASHPRVTLHPLFARCWRLDAG